MPRSSKLGLRRNAVRLMTTDDILSHVEAVALVGELIMQARNDGYREGFRDGQNLTAEIAEVEEKTD